MEGFNTETVTFIECPTLDNSSENVLEPPKDRGSLALDNDKTWHTFFDTDMSNVKPPVMGKYKYNGKYKHASGENKYNGKFITGKISEQITREISGNVKNNTVEYIKLKASRKYNILEPAVRVVLGDYGKEINMNNLLNGDACKKYSVKAVTLCYPDQDKTRGIRLRTDVHDTKIYEVANGSYQMTLTWHVDGNECNVKISVHDDGPVKLIEGNGVSMEQLAANNVKVGEELKALPLHKALASQF